MWVRVRVRASMRVMIRASMRVMIMIRIMRFMIRINPTPKLTQRQRTKTNANTKTEGKVFEVMRD
jgi:hypothetical protein